MPGCAVEEPDMRDAAAAQGGMDAAGGRVVEGDGGDEPGAGKAGRGERRAGPCRPRLVEPRDDLRRRGKEPGAARELDRLDGAAQRVLRRAWRRERVRICVR